MIADRYEIERAIGRGAFGRTFVARDVVAARTVAIKLFDRKGDADLKALELFEREASVLRAMRHQGIPEIFEFVRDEWEGVPAHLLVMEYIEGSSLEELLDRQEQFEPTVVVYLLLEMPGILEYLHASVPPILHRDIKPANIIVRTDGRPTLVDFGAVRRVFMNPDESGSSIVGTYGYMPYEQYMGQASPSSDLYSLAATFLHLLTGRAPRDFMTGEGRIEVPEQLPGDPRLAPVIARMLRPSVATTRVGGVAGTSIAATNDGGARMVKRAPIDLSLLGAASRELRGNVRDLLVRLAPSTLDMMDAGAKPADKRGFFDYVTVAFFSTLTIGILPLVFVSLSRARRRRLRRFLRDGEVATAEVRAIEASPVGFEVNLSKVTYEFVVDDVLHRDSDVVRPLSANRWRVGDRIQILFIAALDFDSVIVSG